MWNGISQLLAHNSAKQPLLKSVEVSLSLEKVMETIKELFPHYHNKLRPVAIKNGLLILGTRRHADAQEIVMSKIMILRYLKDRGLPVRDLVVRPDFEMSE